MVFFSPSTGILSYVTVHDNLLKAEGVQVGFKIQFLNILDGTKLVEYAVLEVLAMFIIVVVLGFDTFTKVYIDCTQHTQRVAILKLCNTLQCTATHCVTA